MTTYYVSSEIGSNNNAGTSATAPLATLQAAANRVQPGDTVEVMNGTYTGPQGGDVVDITTSGTASAPITFEAAPGQTPVINSSGSWNAIKIEASYIVVNGFTVVGDAANYTLSQALAGYSTGSAKLDGAGINVTGNLGVNVPNHITIENNTVYNEPGAGIGSWDADYLNILNNVVYDNAHWSAFGNSGISIFESGNSDTNSGVHDVISGNLVFGNAQLVPTNGAGMITDGEGIILDTNTAFGFVGEILVENNVVYGNGSAGIESFRTNGAVITENTVYGNNTANVLPESVDEIFINQSNNDIVTNNTTTAPDLTPPTISSLIESPSSGDLNAGKTVTFTLNFNEAVTVAGGTPTLTLNDGGVATYTGGSGSNALTFSYAVAVGQNTAALAATAVNLNSATVKDGADNAANLSLSGLTQSGTQVNTTTPTIASLDETPSTGDLNAGNTVTFTLNLNEAVTVAGGTPTLTLNDGGVATYTGGSGSNALTFSYTVAAGRNTAALAATVFNLNSATITDGAGNAANLSLSGLTQSGPQVDTTTPTIASLAEMPSTADLNAGNTVTFILNLNEAVTVAGGTPTLTLNDGGVATYTGGSGSNALTFSYTVAAGQNTSTLAATAINLNSASITDGAGNAANLSLTGLTQSGPQIDTTIPSVTAVSASPSGGVEVPGNIITLTLAMSEAVVITGTPTLTLNDGGTATYSGGSGTNALTFTYTVGGGDGAVLALSITQANLSNGASITDGAGNAANLAGAIAALSGLQIDPGSIVTSVAESPATGDFTTGQVITFTLNLSEAVTVAGGDTPTLTLNDGGTATYTGGSSTNALTFSYTVAAGQNTSALTASAINLNSASIIDSAGNAANLSLTGLTQSGPQVDTLTPTATSLAEPTSGDLNAGKVVTITVGMSEVVTVNTTGGTPTLSLNDGGSATYVGGSGTNALTFSYTVLPGQNTPDLMETAVNLNGAMIEDGAGNTANLSLAGLPQGSPQIDTTAPTISSLAQLPASSDLNAGKTVTFTLKMSELVNVADGTPTLTLNDGGNASYSGGSGTNALTFSYTVAAGQSTSALAATAVNLNSATITDGAGNAANLSLSGLTQNGPQIDTLTPTITSLAEAPASGDLNGRTVTFTLNLNEAVTVAGGPTLTLNDGGTATYTGSSGSSALTFSYTIGAGQNTSALAATAINLNSATITDGAGNAANLSLAGLIQRGPQIDTRPPPAPIIISDKVIGKRVVLSGTEAENGTVISIYDGTTLLGTTATGTKGTWVYTTGPLTNGAHAFTAMATDAAGNVSAASRPYDPNVGAGPAITAALIEVGNQSYIYNSAGSGVALSYAGNSVTDGEFGAWTPIAATQTAGGYDVAWQNTATGQYRVWTTDSNGNYTGNLIAAVKGNSYALESLETMFNQDLNGDGVTGLNPHVIQTDTSSFGSTSLGEIGNNYFLFAAGGTSGPELQYKRAAVRTGEFGSWNPIGAVQRANGYEVAWRNTVTGQYTAWTTGTNGNYTGNLIGALKGNSYTLESLETVFKQDLNGDGMTGLNPHVIQTDTSSFASTSLGEIGNNYFLFAAGGTSGPELQYKGAAVRTGEFGSWKPIGAVQTANGYEVAWLNTSTRQYTVWATNSNGKYTGNVIGAVSGNNYALESFETVFNQDLNSDGVTGLNPLVIQAADTNSFGSTSLAQIANNYFLFASGGTTGPELQYDGAAVTSGKFGSWKPIGAVQTANGYEVAWLNTSTRQYTVWTTDSNGNYSGNLIGAVSGNSYALESLEPVFNQDLNGDGNVGLYAASGTTVQISQSLSDSSGSATIGANATLELAADDSASLTFAASTGQLKLDQPSSFTGDIFNFSGDGTLSGSDHIDLKGMDYSTIHDSYANGVLTVTDGRGDTAKLNFNGSYVLANFAFASDGNGGTIVYDPPASSSCNQKNTTDLGSGTTSAMIGNGATPELPAGTSASVAFTCAKGAWILGRSASGSHVPGFGGQNVIDLPDIAFDGQTTLGYAPNGYPAEGTSSLSDGIHVANIALLGSYTASSFAIASDGHGGTSIMAESTIQSPQLLLGTPHH